MLINKEFNLIQLDKIDQLLAKEKSTYRIDMHIHTSHSADGLQDVKQALINAREHQFDIISFTDHDSINAYADVLKTEDYWRNSAPIILPGIEFTVLYPKYEGRCHVLKYFYDIENKDFNNNLKQNNRAYWNRVEIWFQRINENKCLQYFFHTYGISCTKEKYIEYLKKSKTHIPEYPSLMAYLYLLLNDKGICVWDVYEKSIKINEQDTCALRREKRQTAYQQFYQKYAKQDIAHNYRKLRPILAPLNIDDWDYPTEQSSGSLSVNYFNQVTIYDLLNCGFNVLAHPDINKLFCINDLIEKNVIQGLELNCRSLSHCNKIVYEKAKSMSLLITVGSDKHVSTNELYDKIDFYDISHAKLQAIAHQARKSLR